MADQYAVRLDNLRLLLARDAGGATCEPDTLSLTRTHHVVARWKRAGLVEGQKLLAAEPLWVWPTSRGLRHVGVPYPAHVPIAVTLPHLHAIARVRLRVEARHPEARWLSERSLRTGSGASVRGLRQPHVPDAVLVPRPGASTQDASVPLADPGTPLPVPLPGWVAIEVELTVKGPDRLTAILEELAAAYHTVWYFVAAEAVPSLRRARATLNSALRRRIRVYDLSGEQEVSSQWDW
jgi:hypothetical protein